MENASKALIMAASVLVGIMVLSLAVYLIVSFGSTSAKLHKENAQTRIEQFNAQFTSYEGRNNLTIHDIVTLANLATENNKSYEFLDQKMDATKNDLYVTVLKGTSHMENIGDYTTYIQNDMNSINDEGNLPQYICKVSISENTKRVYLVQFTPKTP